MEEIFYEWIMFGLESFEYFCVWCKFHTFM